MNSLNVEPTTTTKSSEFQSSLFSDCDKYKRISPDTLLKNVLKGEFNGEGEIEKS